MMKKANFQAALLLLTLLFILVSPNNTMAQQTCNPVDDIWIDSNTSTPTFRSFVWDKVPGAASYTIDVTVNGNPAPAGTTTLTALQVIYDLTFSSNLLNADVIEIQTTVNCSNNNSSTTYTEVFNVTETAAVEIVFPEGIHCYDENHEWPGYCKPISYYSTYHFIKLTNTGYGGNSNNNQNYIVMENFLTKEAYETIIKEVNDMPIPIPINELHHYMLRYQPSSSPNTNESCDEIQDKGACTNGGGNGGSGRITNSIPSLIYPNPTSSITNLSFSVEEESNVTVSVINIEGKEVISVAQNETMPAGVYSKDINAQELPMGLYKIKININGETEMLSLLISE